MIKAGDLVWVARGMTCCGYLTGAEGMYFVVSGVRSGRTGTGCLQCGDGASARVMCADGCPGRRGIELGRLKKIDPPALPESITEKEGITA